MKDPRELSLLVDTNVWLGNYIDDRVNSQSSLAFTTAAIRAGVQLLYPASIAKDVYFLVEQELKRRIRAESGTLAEADALAAKRYAFASLENMRAIATAVGADEADLWLACKYQALHPDFEDNLVLAAAERSHADYLVTDDAQLRGKSPVSAKSSQDMADLIAFWTSS